jgi:hypothetical protein
MAHNKTKQTKQTKLATATKRAAVLVQAHLDTLPPAEAKAMRREIHALAVKASRSSRSGKALRTRKTEDSRPLSRTSAKSA